MSENLSEELLNLLICPVCRGEVELTEFREGERGLKCEKCSCIYPVKEGIPLMVEEESIKL